MICTMSGVVFTRNGGRSDSSIWPVRIRVSPQPWAVSVLATCLSGYLAMANPSRAETYGALASEVSVAQLAPGVKLRVAARRQLINALRPPVETSAAELKKMAEAAATAHTLPVDYFLRLIRRESRFDPNSISPAGAQGIAQFMPATAFERGLKDPFDPTEALPKSAELLSELRAHFGNLGLAAAAYNAGAERVRKWLAGKGQLPQETIDYVRIVTGHDAVDWAKANNLTIDLGPGESGPERRVRVDRLSWEARLLATLQATSGPTKSDATVSAIKGGSAPSGRGEMLLCPGCIVQTAY
jgi:hypothetical protein